MKNTLKFFTVLVLLGGIHSFAAELARPNIVMIVSDDVNKAYHGCYGGRTPTPHLDSLAENGIIFNRAIAITPMCNPSRHSFLTGQFPGTDSKVLATASENEPYMVYQNSELEVGSITIGRILRDAGYFTGFVGKWHNNFEVGQIGKSRIPYPSGTDVYSPEYDTQLKKKHAQDIELVKASTGFEFADSILMGNYPNGKPRQHAHHNVEWQTRGALNFLNQAATDERPFFLYIAHSVPHGPNPHEAHDKDPRSTLGGLIDPPEENPSRESVKQRLIKEGITPDGPIYGINYGVVQLDDSLGVIMDRLKAMDALENTIIIYFSDHGIYGKFSSYFGGIDMPMMIQWPKKISAGGQIDTGVSYVDLVPTLIAAAGTQAPEGYRLDGINLLPLLTEGAKVERQGLYSECGYTRSLVKGKYHYVALRYPERIIDAVKAGEHAEAIDHYGNSKGNGKTFWAGDLNIRYKPYYFDLNQLYDIEADPNERTNLARDPAYAEVLADMQQELETCLNKMDRPFDLDAVDPFFESATYRKLCQKRFDRVSQKPYYPQGYDAEKIYNFNLKDPLAGK